MHPAEDHLLAGRYVVGALLGQGGCASVHDGFDTRLARPVAIKQLRPEMAADAAMRRRFEQEARTAAQLTHPNAVAVYDTGAEDGRTFLVMERLPGRSLADRIAEGPLEPEEAAGVGADVLAALQAAHGLGMVHRDVKPGNILLTDEGRAKVGDFGIAKSADRLLGDTTMADATAMGLVVGTPAYLAPECLTGQPATPQADLYALGVVLYEALTGSKPGPAPDHVPGAPAALERVVLRALSPRPADRYSSAAEMAASLDVARRLDAGASPSDTCPTMVSLAALGAVPFPSAPRGAPVDPTLTGAGRPVLGRWWRRTTRRRPVALGSLLGVAALAAVAVAATGGGPTGHLPVAQAVEHSRQTSLHRHGGSGSASSSTTGAPASTTTSAPAVQTLGTATGSSATSVPAVQTVGTEIASRAGAGGDASLTHPSDRPGKPQGNGPRAGGPPGANPHVDGAPGGGPGGGGPHGGPGHGGGPGH